jgi:hypothetical protein
MPAHIEVGDKVEVPGGMDGTVKFVGEVRGKNGYFVGVELSRKWASKGKNDGDAEGVRYFSTTIPGAGIFLPVNRAVKISSPTNSAGSVPRTPNTPNLDTFDLGLPEGRSSPMPAARSTKFSQSVHGGRPPSPFKAKRPSLPRPESPLRRAQAAPTSQPTTTPMLNGRQSLNMLSHNRLQPGPRYVASPTPAKMAGPRASITRDSATPRPSSSGTTGSDEISKLREENARLRAETQRTRDEMRDKMAAMTADFDSHRADFRSTLDALELASSETERVYEQRVAELLEEKSVLQASSALDPNNDLEAVAQQLRDLEEVVQELEEGLEDARRGEAEARGEVEFLRGEVERLRAQLRHEKENPMPARTPTPHRIAPLTRSTPEPTTLAMERNERTSLEQRAAHTRGESIPSRDKENDKEREKVEVHKEIAAPPKQQEMPAEDKWCALCEADGHDFTECPLDKDT